MKLYTRTIATLLISIFGAAQPLVDAQETSTALTPEREARLSALLSQVCEAGDDETRLRKALAEFAGPGAEQFVVQILAQGAPADQRKATREAARRRYAMRAARLAESTDKLFDARTAERLRAVDEETYVRSAVEVIDLVYRENALRALGVFGSKGSLAAIEKAVDSTPSLELLAAEATAAINAR